MIATRERALVDEAGTRWVRVADVDRMEPFLVTVVSACDLWLYASSTGGLTAGRVRPEGALFPYQTDDRLHRARQDAGAWTCLHVSRADGAPTTWEPFRPRNAGEVRRHLLKSERGDRLILEEVHPSLGLVFRQRWALSDRFGVVRTATLHNVGPTSVAVGLVDGLNGLLPAGAPLAAVQSASCLVDAYTRAEWDPEGALALITLEAQISDRPRPAESLRATVAWCAGLPTGTVLLSRGQLEAVATGTPPRNESLVTGRPAAFLVAATLSLEAGASHSWHLVCDTGLGHLEVADLRARGIDPGAAIEAEVGATSAAMDGIVADVDGLQCTADPIADVHHRASALFNAMRGGVPVDGHRVSVDGFASFVGARNGPCRERCAGWFDARAGLHLEVEALLAAVDATGDPDLVRLGLEVLPLWFGRRHGDPSRPWNTFAIRVRDPQGARRVAWEGNWRDVFQNWEGLLLAYPAFLESAIAKFVNASTRDGHNPYRITSDGVDWEVPDAENPWSNIGYWGDHQVAYLTRLLEASRRHHPGRLAELIDREVFSYADVPYRIGGHAQVVRDPRDSIRFDDGAQLAVDARVDAIGSDGRLVPEGAGVLHVNLAEKLLVPVLAKLSNLIPGAGIWMNTQRPEWNDANNALAGTGVSVVTAARLLRHLRELETLFSSTAGPVRLTAPVARWLDGVGDVLRSGSDLLAGPIDDRDRRRVLDALGEAAGRYRSRVYAGGDPERTERPLEDLRALCRHGAAWLVHALSAARRPDGLYDGYDLVRLGPDTASVERLYPMLEGQVAVLSAGVLSAAAAADLVERMFDGPLYRPDVDSFVLYPIRALPSFLGKNAVPEDAAVQIPLVRGLLAAGDRRLVARDAGGVLRFAPDLRNAADVGEVLDALEGEAVEADRQPILDLWEAVFHHHAFTGRSGTMYAYEGIGSVYWHMVGKLLVAVQEVWAGAVQDGASPAVVARLAGLYHRVRGGLGWQKTAARFGAIPTDPYSHTPAGRGAQQPGMTGLVKEELVARRGELGVEVLGGRLRFAPRLLDPAELTARERVWRVPAGVRPAREVRIPAAGLGFLVCGIPVVYRQTPHRTAATVRRSDGEKQVFADAWLDRATSAAVFRRDPALVQIEVDVSIPEVDP